MILLNLFKPAGVPPYQFSVEKTTNFPANICKVIFDYYEENIYNQSCIDDLFGRKLRTNKYNITKLFYQNSDLLFFSSGTNVNKISPNVKKISHLDIDIIQIPDSCICHLSRFTGLLSVILRIHLARTVTYIYHPSSPAAKAKNFDNPLVSNRILQILCIISKQIETTKKQITVTIYHSLLDYNSNPNPSARFGYAAFSSEDAQRAENGVKKRIEGLHIDKLFPLITQLYLKCVVINGDQAADQVKRLDYESSNKTWVITDPALTDEICHKLRLGQP